MTGVRLRISGRAGCAAPGGRGAGCRLCTDALDPRGRHQARTGRNCRRTSARVVDRRGERAYPAGAVGILAASRPDRDGAARQPAGLRLQFAALAAAIYRRKLCDSRAQSSRSCHQYTHGGGTRAADLQRWLDAARSAGGDVGARHGHGDPGYCAAGTGLPGSAGVRARAAARGDGASHGRGRGGGGERSPTCSCPPRGRPRHRSGCPRGRRAPGGHAPAANRGGRGPRGRTHAARRSRGLAADRLGCAGSSCLAAGACRRRRPRPGSAHEAPAASAGQLSIFNSPRTGGAPLVPRCCPRSACRVVGSSTARRSAPSNRAG